MKKLILFKSLLFLFIVPGLLLSCQSVNDKAGETTTNPTPIQDKANVSQDLAPALTELTDAYKVFKSSQDEFLTQLKEVVEGKREKDSVNSKDTLQNLQEVKKQKDNIQKKLQSSRAIKVTLENINSKIQSIENIVKPLENGLEPLDVKKVQNTLKLLSKNRISKRNLGNFGKVTQSEVQSFLTEQTKELESQITQLETEVKSFTASGSTLFEKNTTKLTQEETIKNLEVENKRLRNELTARSKQQLSFNLMTIVMLSFLLGITMGALAMFIYQQERKFTSEEDQVQADGSSIGKSDTNESNTQSTQSVSSQTPTLQKISQPPTPPVLPQPTYAPNHQMRQPTHLHHSSPETQSRLVTTYNQNRNSLSKSAIEVSETQESINQRRLGSNQPAILEKVGKGKGNYWIISEQNLDYLVPKGNIKINEFNYKTIEVLFSCESYQAGHSNDFAVIKPAQVHRIAQDRWELVDYGILKF